MFFRSGCSGKSQVLKVNFELAVPGNAVRREVNLQRVLMVRVVCCHIAFPQGKSVAQFTGIDDPVLIGLVLGIFLVIKIVVEV